MIIFIPLGGKGIRFKKNGFQNPKALIKAKNKEIIFHLIDNINYDKKIDYIYIAYNKEYKEYNLEDKIKSRYNDYKFKFLFLEHDTGGAAETLKKALDIMEEDKPILSLDSDNFYLTDIIKFWEGDNKIFYFKDYSQDSIFSYISISENNITEIKEKQKISDNACCGAYGFKSSKELLYYCNYIIDNDIKDNKEFYISTVVKEMLKNNIKFSSQQILNKNYFTLGTPENLSKYEHTLLFDLDGTLVKTDVIYTQVWKDILKDYNIIADDEFFNQFIQGRSDNDFLSFLIPNICKEDIKKISINKDIKFVNYLKKSDKNILIDGAKKFIEKNKNMQLGIVTNCNKLSAEYILDYTELSQYINVVIASEDCNKHKPHSEPYDLAIEKLSADKNKTIIFEDSISGYLSAKNSKISNIILVNNKKNKDLNCFKINNYLNLEPNFNNENKDIYIPLLKEKLSFFPIKDIIPNHQKIKTGYICDIEKYKIVYYNEKSKDIILKISNFNNELADVAKKLNLYNNEIYFYEKLSNNININIPKFYGTILNKGIIMENIYNYKGIFNINLNNNIKIILKIIEDISNMHNYYYFSDRNNLINCMKNLKTVKQITYYKELIEERFSLFMNKNNRLISEKIKKLLHNIYNNFDNNLNYLSEYPLSFCHGDLKSPNIFYKDNIEPFYLDWQYIHLNKGISDIAFLLVESIDFDPIISDIIIKYYYKLTNRIDYEKYLTEFKISLQIFPFFVMVWFNSEDNDKLLDKSFPIKFMKNLFNYYDYYF